MHRDLLCAAVDLSHDLVTTLREEPCDRWMARLEPFIQGFATLCPMSADAAFALLASVAEEVRVICRQRDISTAIVPWHAAVRPHSVEQMFASFRVYLASVVQQSQSHGIDRVSVAMRFIDEHYAEALTTAKVAAAVGLERTYLSTVFKRRTGQTLHGYLMSVRLRHAMALIRRGDKIEAAMLSVGYRSKRSFYRLVRLATGATPAALREVPGDGVDLCVMDGPVRKALV